MREVQVFAFSTASSNATLPVTLRTTQEKLGVDRWVSLFSVPLGATIKMDGTAVTCIVGKSENELDLAVFDADLS